MLSTTGKNVKTVRDRLVYELRRQSNFNPNVEVGPACILWPDGERHFEPVIAGLQEEMPELCVLGDYLPEQRTGPAIWLRLVIAGKEDDVAIPAGHIPIIYLPGVRRQDLRAVDDCDEKLKPLAELQFRGTIWSQQNSKDWTILAFLSSSQGGLGLRVEQDNDTKNSLRPSLYVFLDERLDLLQGRNLDKDYFNSLIAGGDPTKNLLLWLNEPQHFKDKCDANAWIGFVEVCKSQFKFNPESDGPIEAGYLLAEKTSPWNSVWDRFADAPHRYPNIPDQIRKSQPPAPTGLFPDRSGWPQWNESQETELCDELKAIADKDEVAARDAVITADKTHAERRTHVWAELGQSPLAMAVKHLAKLAEITKESIAGGEPADMVAAYTTRAWQADDAVLQSLECSKSDDDLEAISCVIRAIYQPWAEQSAFHLQKQVLANGYPGGDYQSTEKPDLTPGTCFFFVDGLRYDLAKRICEKLEQRKLEFESSTNWAALPSVTATAKPAVTPVAHLLKGEDVNDDFYPSIGESGKPAESYHLQKLMEAHDCQIISKTDLGDPSGIGWCATGDIDSEGHKQEWKLARTVDNILDEVVEQVEQLFKAGWKTVRIVTDHGFLLMPGQLPTSSIPASLAVNKWGRCAAMKPGAQADENLFPWYWNPTQSFALASGISTYRKRMFSHGGLSLQECVTMGINIKNPNAAAVSDVTIDSVAWTNMICKVKLTSAQPGVQLDIRTHPGNPATSVVSSIKTFNEKTKASVIVEDEDLEGHEVHVVLLDENKNPIAQQTTVVGGN